MMLIDPKDLKHVAFPMVESIYLKKEHDAFGREKNESVLVVNFKSAHLGTKEDQDKLYLDFLSNLDLLRDEVEQKSGKFSRIDIRRH